jgi:hypothetical protein
MVEPFAGNPALPSQLVKLTRLHVFCNNAKGLPSRIYRATSSTSAA